ncbi:DUF2911 domain-containing protein [Nonlabens sp.]|uniref:DUF2911 domain-containing protein n=1 Tax=Nonlabens sp. TaxID=1888209 RepID=UPI0025F3FE14|nr:DUF2911 domain-containing protein [Nonlabens sp.]
MKYTIIFLGLVLMSACKETSQEVDVAPDNQVTQQETPQAEPVKKKPLSPHTSAMAMIGDAHIHFDYSSPGVRDRIVFGGLLPYNVVWQAGAHQATWMETNKDLSIAGKKLKAGKYGFFVIPNEKEWTVIFNSNWDQHGKDEYDKKDDVVRLKITPQTNEDIQEHLEYKVIKTSDSSGRITLSWEKILIEFPFEVN